MFSIVKVARDQTQPGSLLSRLGGKMRDPGNEVALYPVSHSYATVWSFWRSVAPRPVFDALHWNASPELD